MPAVIIVHGGAGTWNPAFDGEAKQGVHQATKLGWDVLQDDGSALDAVEKAVNFLEDHPLYDAGVGSHLNTRGEVEMDAIIVDANQDSFGAIAGVKTVQHPISLARRVLEDTEHCFFVGQGADDLARDMGFPYMPNIEFITDTELMRFRRHKVEESGATGTVGAVAIDNQGNIAVATSTGGVHNKRPGRVGDTPLFGAGAYADITLGGVSATGVGEQVMRYLLGHYAVHQLDANTSAQNALINTAQFIQSKFDDPQVGLIMVDAQGNVGAMHTTQAMPTGWVDKDGNIQSSMGGGINGLG
jgi:L-asparaginase / beta-aspartyl-peptidase